MTNVLVCTWQVVFTNVWDGSTGVFGWDRIGKRVGGPIGPLGDSLTLKVLIDHSLVEVFTASGHALTTRCLPFKGILCLLEPAAARCSHIATY
jgi:hypothetical protein